MSFLRRLFAEVISPCFGIFFQEIHYPKGKNKPLPKECTNPGAYPVALIPGQFQEYYKKYANLFIFYFFCYHTVEFIYFHLVLNAAYLSYYV